MTLHGHTCNSFESCCRRSSSALTASLSLLASKRWNTPKLLARLLPAEATSLSCPAAGRPALGRASVCYANFHQHKSHPGCGQRCYFNMPG